MTTAVSTSVSTAPGNRDTATVTMLRILYFGVCLFGVAFSVLGYSQNLAERSELAAAWSIPSFVLLLVLPLIIVIGAPWMPLAVLRVIAATLILTYFVSLATWPLALTDAHVFDGTRPWIYGHYATTVSLIGILLPEIAAWVAIAFVTAMSGVLRVVAEGWGATNFAVQDTLFNLMIGTILVAMIQVTLRAGRARDKAAAATAQALASTAAVAAQVAQRSRVAAIIHDDVISTLIAGARFDARTATLVRGYALKALDRLDALKVGTGARDETIGSDALGATLRSSAPLLATGVTFSSSGPVISLPATVGEALIEAASEALRNSERHALASRRSIAVETNADHITIEIADDGAGFDPRRVSSERFGIAVSIRERMSAAGGAGEVVSSVGAGTRVILNWPVAL